MVKLENICKSFGPKSVLRDFSLEIEEGERFVLLGQSGCGKTTLLRLIAGFEKPDAGKIIIGGEEMKSLPAEKRPVGFIFQRHALFPHMTVYDNIAVGPRIRGVDEKEIEKNIDELLEVTRLQDLRASYPAQLSGGESQRVAIARAVINRPKVLLLDEPLSSLDVNLRRSLRAELAEMQRAFGITFLFVTHDREEAMSLADRMGVMDEGRLLQAGPPAELYDRPGSPFIAQFLGDVNRFEGTVAVQKGNRVTVTAPGAGRLACFAETAFASDTRVVCLVRPERMFLSAQGQVGETDNLLEGVLQEKAFLGSSTISRVRLKNGATIKVIAQHKRYDAEAPVLCQGDPVRVMFDCEDVILFRQET